MNQFNSIVAAVAELGEPGVLDWLNAQAKARAYRKSYQKRVKVAEREIIKAFKDGKLSFGGTRVDVGNGEVVVEEEVGG